MGQSWQILCFSQEQCWSGPKLGEFFWCKENRDWIGLLTYPLCHEDTNPLAGWSTGKELHLAVDSKPTAPLLRLPPEVINMIFGETDSMTSAIALCTAHIKLGVVGESRVWQLIKQILTPWAGEVLACIGSYAQVDDYPPRLSPYVAPWTEEHRHRSRPSPKYFEEYVDLEYRSLTGPISAYDLRPSNLFPSRRGEMRPLLTSEDERKIEKLRSVFGEKVVYPDVESAVLCNLSKSVYVRGSAIKDLGQPGGRATVSLAQVLLSKICWSTDNSCSMRGDNDRLVCGPWAGHRFEITTLAGMRKDIEWVDVTDESVAWVEELYRANFGN